MDKKSLLRVIYAKYNELDSVKKHVKDETTIAVINGKQETLDDIQKLLESSYISD
ncbi:hypothetical protein BRE01_67320 [Brevibacillus reuszeri]|uniref:Uncharacterized protein n=1 Tax=Brevibacillus reuszeri TaxID=54915 RepID=A0ABQ0TYX2_9BACL|nr:hypothetical protein [Brevibacillus reuszeri]GED73030.1 hypothetical protein BRE01_67320 [Brevibacillus reuszeri]